MFYVDEWLDTSKSALSMVPSIISVMKELRAKNEEPSTQKLIQELVIQSKETCEQMFAEVSEMEEDIKRIVTTQPLDQPLANIYDKLGWFSEPVVKFKLGNRLSRMTNIKKRLILSSESLAALIICNGRAESVGAAYAENREIRKTLAEMTVRDTPFLEQTEQFKKNLDNFIWNLSR